MATAREPCSPVCPVCLESHEALKILETCKHSFCLPCLSRHFARHISKTIPCPTCQVECTVPNGGLEMLEDFTGVEKTDDIGTAMEKCEQKVQVTDQIDQTRDLDKLVDVKCQICHHQNIVVQADNFCDECDQLHLCKECTTLHATSKATRHHAVVSLKVQSKGNVVCVKHNAHTTKFCTTCNRPACKICVMLDHRDHDVESLNDIIVTKIDRVKATIKEKEDEVKKLQCLTKQFSLLMPVATQLDQRAVMFQDIEDHAQKWVDHIVAWKENMNDQVDKKFQITSDIPKSFEDASKVIKQLQKALSKAGALLANTEQVPSYLQKLTTIQLELDKVPKTSIETNEPKYSECLSDLQQRYPKFQPEAPRLPIGNLDFQVKSGQATEMFKLASGDLRGQQQGHLKVQAEAPPLPEGKRDIRAPAGNVTEMFKLASGDMRGQQQRHLMVQHFQPEAPPLPKGKRDNQAPAGQVTEMFKLASGDMRGQQQRHLKVQPEALPLPKGKRDNQAPAGQATEMFKLASGDLRGQQQRHMKVQPEAPPLPKGKCDIQAPAGNVTEMFKYTVGQLSASDYIRYVTILGDKCAIASSNHSIHIYELNGKFCRKLTHHVNPTHDMSSTLHGKLAILTNGISGASTSSVKVIDPDSGSIISTLNHNIPLVESFCVGLQNQFVFLSYVVNHGLEITVANEDGRTQLKQEVDVDNWQYFPTISCSLRFIFLACHQMVHVFEMKGACLVKTATISVNTPDLYLICDISATARDHFIIVTKGPSQTGYSVRKYSQKEGEEKWATYDEKQIFSNHHSPRFVIPMISTNKHRIVVAYEMTTIKVYKY